MNEEIRRIASQIAEWPEHSGVDRLIAAEQINATIGWLDQGVVLPEEGLEQALRLAEQIA